MPYYIVKGKDSRGKVRRSLPAYLISSSHRTHKTVPDEEKGLDFLAPDEVYFCLTKILSNPIKILAVRFSLTSLKREDPGNEVVCRLSSLSRTSHLPATE